jgi:hypothetical protein
MMMPGRAMMSSCTDGLQFLLNEGLEPREMNQPKINCTILLKIHHASVSNVCKLKDELEGLNLQKAPAGNGMECNLQAFPLI